MALRAVFLDLIAGGGGTAIGDTADEIDPTVAPPHRRASRLSVQAAGTSARPGTTTLQPPTTRSGAATVTARSAASGRPAHRKLGATLMQVSTAFDAVPYGLNVSRADRGPGGVASAFSFYSQLFSAAKQMATRAAAVSTEDAERADSTMSVGELCFLLRDFKVMPQLINRAELFYILSRRTLGRELRKRRERHDLLLSMLRREEEDLARDMRDAKMVPTSPMPAVGATRATSLSPSRRAGATGHTTVSVQDVARMDRIAARRERISNMRLMLRKFDAAVLDPSTKVEARMEVSGGLLRPLWWRTTAAVMVRDCCGSVRPPWQSPLPLCPFRGFLKPAGTDFHHSVMQLAQHTPWELSYTEYLEVSETHE